MNTYFSSDFKALSSSLSVGSSPSSWLSFDWAFFVVSSPVAVVAASSTEASSVAGLTVAGFLPDIMFSNSVWS